LFSPRFGILLCFLDQSKPSFASFLVLPISGNFPGLIIFVFFFFFLGPRSQPLLSRRTLFLPEDSLLFFFARHRFPFPGPPSFPWTVNFFLFFFSLLFSYLKSPFAFQRDFLFLSPLSLFPPFFESYVSKEFVFRIFGFLAASFNPPYDPLISSPSTFFSPFSD